jgi:hypothetical protein
MLLKATSRATKAPDSHAGQETKQQAARSERHAKPAMAVSRMVPLTDRLMIPLFR